jgi:hypothetical protein
MKILSGVYPDYEGQIIFKVSRSLFRNSRCATGWHRNYSPGIKPHSLVKHRENIFLGKKY